MFINVVSSFLAAMVPVAAVHFSGGPAWSQWGFGLVAYLVVVRNN